MKTDNELLEEFIGNASTVRRQLADKTLEDYPGRNAMGCVLFHMHHHSDNLRMGEIVYKETDIVRLLEFLGYPVKFGDE